VRQPSQLLDLVVHLGAEPIALGIAQAPFEIGKGGHQAPRRRFFDIGHRPQRRADVGAHVACIAVAPRSQSFAHGSALLFSRRRMAQQDRLPRRSGSACRQQRHRQYFGFRSGSRAVANRRRSRRCDKSQCRGLNPPIA
jgi:hypothetical protein